MPEHHCIIKDFDPDNEEFQLHDYAYILSGDLNLIKRWAEAQIAKGKKSFSMEIDRDYYNDISDIRLSSSETEPYYHE